MRLSHPTCYLSIVFCILVIMVGILVGVRRSQKSFIQNEENLQGNSTVSIPTGYEIQNQQAVQQDGVVAKTLSSSRRASTLDWALLEADDTEISRLQEFLDADDKDSILVQAEFLVVSDDPVRRHAVIRAVQWVNNIEAGRILLPLLQDSNSEIAYEATGTLEHLFDTLAVQVTNDPETNELEVPEGMDLSDIFDFGVEALSNCPDEDACENFMTRISGLDPKLALPILLETMEKGEDWQHDIALKYIDMVTNNDGVTNREEALIWLLKKQEIESQNR